MDSVVYASVAICSNHLYARCCVSIVGQQKERQREIYAVSKPTKSKRTPLAQAREEKGWAQEYVAEQVKVTVDAVRRWEAGRHLPYQKTIQKLCKLFQMTPKQLGLLKQQDNSHAVEQEEPFVDADKTEAYDDPEPLTFQVATPVPSSPHEAAKPTMSDECSFFQSIQGIWEPNDEEKQAAWEIYVELITRIPIAPLGHDEGILREALSSLYSLFPITRTILRSHSPAIAQRHTGNNRSLSYLVVGMLNTTLRPLLAKWHPLLKAYEETRPDNISVTQYEQQWERYTELREEINKVRTGLTAYAHVFAQIAEISSLVIDMPDVRQQEVLVH
jgi:transcriptional regulator with XRE-family HTH domain